MALLSRRVSPFCWSSPRRVPAPHPRGNAISLPALYSSAVLSVRPIWSLFAPPPNDPLLSARLPFSLDRPHAPPFRCTLIFLGAAHLRLGAPGGTTRAFSPNLHRPALPNIIPFFLHSQIEQMSNLLVPICFYFSVRLRHLNVPPMMCPAF